MSNKQRRGACSRCCHPQCGWYQANEPCTRPAEEIEGWAQPPKACKRCGEIGSITLGGGKGPHAAQWICASCGAWQSWVPKWKLELIITRGLAQLPRIPPSA